MAAVDIFLFDRAAQIATQANLPGPSWTVRPFW